MCCFSLALMVSSLLCLADSARIPIERFLRPPVGVPLLSCGPGTLKSVLLVFAVDTLTHSKQKTIEKVTKAAKTTKETEEKTREEKNKR